VPVYSIPDYRLRGGGPERVTVVSLDAVDAFLGTDSGDRRFHLRALRDLGILRHQPGRLTAKVRLRPAVAGDSGIVRAYVFAGDERDMPRKRRPARRSSQRITTW
jgi:hypothetical protein